MSGLLTDGLVARQFMLAGSCTVTLRSLKSGVRFTYKIAAPHEDTENGGRRIDHAANVRFVKLLNGPDNESDYAYLGAIFLPEGRYGHDKKRRISPDAPSAKALMWAWEYINLGIIPDQLEVWHEGACGRCGRKLTDPLSISRGFGSDCWGMV